MVELRKRKAATEAAPAPPIKKTGPKAVATKGKPVASANGSSSSSSSSTSAVTVGSTITLEGFGGEIETNNGEKTDLKKLVDDSKGGVVLFTYPKASTPGCTQQACMFRDEFAPLTATGFAIYGLSRDSPKSNTTFKTKQNLPYPLLCDPSATLIGAIGLKKAAGTTRGVFVVDRDGKVLAAEGGSPKGTVEVVRKLVGEGSSTAEADISGKQKKPTKESKGEKAVEEVAPVTETAAPPSEANGTAKEKEDEAKADIAADVADTAEKLDGGASA